MGFMIDDPNSANGTPNGTPTSPKSARTPSTQRVIVTDSATPTAKRPAVVSRGIKESPLLPASQKSPEDSPASTSNTPSTILLCPVTGKPIPSLETIEKGIDENLTLWNWRWPRSIAVKGISLALWRWAQEVGLEKAARRAEVLLAGDRPLEYADQANLPWINLDQIEALTPEDFANRLGGIVDELERTEPTGDGAGDNQGDQRVLPSDGAAGEGGGADGPGPEAGDVEAVGGGGPGERGPGEGGRVVAFPSRRADSRGGRQGLHRSHVVLELEEHERDLAAFQESYNCIHRRVQEVKDEGRLMKLVEWSGTSAVMGSLEMAIHAVERVVEELRDILQRIDAGVIPNLDEESDV